MKKIPVLLLSICLVFVFSSYSAVFAQHKESKPAKEKEVHWSYSGEHGPAHWGDLKPEYAPCKDGKSQSPIDIEKTYATKLGSLDINYRPSPLNLVNNGHTIQQNYESGSYVTINGMKYNLIQFHFHTPSEHTVNGKHYAMELHLVHKNKNGRLAVIGVFFKEGKFNKELQTLIDNFPSGINHPNLNKAILINAALLLPKDRSFYRYYGSLTTPACTEGVLWNVIESPLEASKEQIGKFKSLMGNNARPVQPLNDRFVLKSE